MIATIFIILITIFLLGFYKANKYYWSAGIVFVALLFTYSITSSWYVILPLYILSGLVLFAFYTPAFRIKSISQPVMKYLRSQIPPISQTEQEALETGDAAWEAELLSGNPDWNYLDKFQTELTQEEQDFLNGPVEKLCAMIDDWEITHNLHDLPEEVWSYIKEEKFFAMILPKEYGGLGFSARCHSEVVMKIASRSITAAVTVMVPNSLGPGQLLLNYGTDEQKNKYLPTLVSGEDIPCFGLTAPEAGSDATGMVDNGIVCYQEFEGKENVLGIRLNWSKRYITLGPVATLLGLAFKLYDPDQILGENKNIGITLALIPVSTPGVKIGRRHNPGANPFQNGPNSGENVFIPIDWIIGGPDYAGKGWKMLVECLSEGRGVSLPALSTAAAKLSVFTSTAYTMVRRQFRVPLAKFEGIEEALARIIGKTYMLDAARTLTLRMLDAGICPSVATAIMKYHSTEMLREIINDAMDIHGGKAVMLGPKNYLMRTYQALPVFITVEGANILTRSLMIFGQGVMRCHPYLMEEVNLANQGDEAAKEFDAVLWKHVSHAACNASRALFYGLFGFLFCHPGKTKYQLNGLSAALAFSTELTLASVGGKLKQKERLSARLGDALSYLYLASATLHRYEEKQSPEDKHAFIWSIKYTTHKAQEAIFSLSENLPCWAGFLVRTICFPLGRRFKSPDDSLSQKLVANTLIPSEFRNNIVEGIYVPKNNDESLALLDEAFQIADEAFSIESKIKQAKKEKRIEHATTEDAIANDVISENEASLLENANSLFSKIVNVDDFSKEEYKGK